MNELLEAADRLSDQIKDDRQTGRSRCTGGECTGGECTGGECTGGECSTCHWWGDGETCGPVDGVRVECCTHPMVVQPSYGDRDNRTMRRDGVLTCDEGGATGNLMTGTDFGCIHHTRSVGECGIESSPESVNQMMIDMVRHAGA